MIIVPTAAKISFPFLRKPAGWTRLCPQIPGHEGANVPSDNLPAEIPLNMANRLDPIPQPDPISP